MGKTARARKGTGFAEVRRLMNKVDSDWLGRILGGFGSGEAVVDAVRDPTEDAPGADDRRLFVREPELARILKVASRDGSTLSPLIRQAWDGERLEVRTRQRTTIATGAHVSVLGDITVEELRRQVLDTETFNGFANRFLLVACRRSKKLPAGGNLDERELDDLAAQVREQLWTAKRIGKLRRTHTAEARWTDIYNRIDDDVDGLLGAAIARAEAQMLRLSVLYALLDGSDKIDVPHVDAALALWSYSEQTAELIFGSRLGDETADRLLEALIAAGDDGLDFTQQSDVFARHVSKVRLAEARALLERRGLARTVERPTGGRPRSLTFALAKQASEAREPGNTPLPSLLSLSDNGEEPPRYEEDEADQDAAGWSGIEPEWFGEELERAAT